MHFSGLFLAVVIIGVVAQLVDGDNLKITTISNKSPTEIAGNSSEKTIVSLNENTTMINLTAVRQLQIEVRQKSVILVPVRRNCRHEQVQNANGECIDAFSDE